MASLEVFDMVWDMLINNWPKEPATTGRMELYCQLLQDIPDDVLKAATVQVIATSRFFPTIAELRDVALSIMPQTGGLPAAGEAWGEVIAEIRRTGTDQWHGPPVFSHELIGRVVRAMGWRELCLSENGMADRAHFLKIYESLSAREVARARTLPQVRALADALRAAQLPARAETEKAT